MKEGWKYVRLGDVATYINGFAFKPDDWSSKGVPIIRIQNLTDSNRDFNYCNREDIPHKFYVNEGDILISWSATLGVFEWSKGKALLNQHIFKVVFNKIDINKQYFKYAIHMSIDEMAKHTNGATMKHIRKGDFDNIRIPIPPLSEQERIVSLLDAEFAKIDAIKANAEKQLKDAKALFQSALKELSSPKEGWSKNSLGEIATEMYRGSGITRAQVTKEGISCVRYGEIYTAYNYHFSNCISCTEENKIPSKKYFEYGDILFAITGESVEDIGKSIAYLGKDKCLAGGDIVIMKHALNPKFLGYVLSAPYVIKQKGFGKTKLKVVHTNVPSLKSIIIHYPPSLSEQQQIAEQLDKLSAKIKSLQSNFDTTITLCNDLKQSILKDIFG